MPESTRVSEASPGRPPEAASRAVRGEAGSPGWGRVLDGGELQRVADPLALRAIAHPKRLALLELLLVEGTATATRCAQVLGDSPSSWSFHLRTLARYELVEEAPGGVGRRRSWSSAS
jgi:hypothetical protein